MAKISSSLLAVIGSTLVGAAPLEERSSAVCLAVDALVDILKVYPSASPFCSSFLGISTVTTTQTLSTTAAYTSPITTTIPTTVSTFTSTADPVTVYSTSGTIITTCIPSAVDKRGLALGKLGGSSTSSGTLKGSTTSSTAAKASLTAGSASATSSLTSASTNCPGCPNVLEGFACSAVSTACSCLSIATPTSIVTVTRTLSTTSSPTTTAYSSVTATVTYTGTTTIPVTSTSTVDYCPTPSSCNNEGIRWGYYPNDVENTDSLYTNYDPTVIKSDTPDYQATATVCGGLDDTDVGEISIYGSTETFESDYFTLNHVGYIFAEVSGTYTFSFSSVDDIALLWLGDTAYSGWTRDNADMVAVYGATTASTATTYALVQEEYLAFRIVFGQAQGAVDFYFSVAAPDGTIILNSDTTDSPYLVQYSCDGTTAPAFPAFGSET